ncbi:hypothetical protein NL676_019293 [Syzygium grande]|nr:hypothetical protein NL676_019293 [Syzygium grande]
MGVLGFKRLALVVAASIIFTLLAAQFVQCDRCSDYIIRMCNEDCGGVKPFYPCYKQCLRRQTCPPAAAVGTGLLDTAIPGNAHKSTAFNSALAASMTPGATAWPICCARDHKCCHRAQEAEFE